MLTRLDRYGRALARANPWTNVYGLARTLLALGTLGTLLLTPAAALFSGSTGPVPAPLCRGAARLSLFCLAPPAWLDAARLLAVVLLAVVASGWRPRITGVLHWWIAFSVMVAVAVVDGGDQVTAILALLLIPVTLLDARRWHWQRGPARPAGEADEVRRLVARSALLMVRIQVAGIYFHAAVGKFGVPEWADGTAVYYWFTHPAYGMAPWMQRMMMPVLLNGTGVTLVTWGAVFVELALFTGLLAAPRYRPYLLWMGIGLHAGIALVHGLISFALAMFAALILFLRPVDREIRVLHRVPAVVLALSRRMALSRLVPAPAMRKRIGLTRSQRS